VAPQTPHRGSQIHPPGMQGKFQRVRTPRAAVRRPGVDCGPKGEGGAWVRHSGGKKAGRNKTNDTQGKADLSGEIRQWRLTGKIEKSSEHSFSREGGGRGGGGSRSGWGESRTNKRGSQAGMCSATLTSCLKAADKGLGVKWEKAQN